MNKRALLLTAATVALLSGQAWAATDTITTKVTTPLKTSTAGTGSTHADIDLSSVTSGSKTTYGTIELSSPSGTPPAVEIDSSNIVKLDATSNTITYSNVSNAVGIQADQGNQGEIVSAGTLTLIGSGTDKVGIRIGDPNTAVGTFTGVSDADNSYSAGEVTALNLEAGSAINILGDGSTGMILTAGNTVTGDLIFAGDMSVTSSTATGTPGAVTAIAIGGSDTTASTVNGNIVIDTTGIIEAVGPGAQGLEVLGQINGAIINKGILEAKGSSSLSATKTNPNSGSAIIISDSVTGGLVNFGPSSNTDATGVAEITASGQSPAILMETGYATSEQHAITIGGYTDAAGVDGVASFLNRGLISGSATNPNSNAYAIIIGGASSTYEVTFSDKFVNSGGIEASATTTSSGNTSSHQVYALDIAQYVNIASGIINKTEATSSADISASLTGAAPGSAYAISIGLHSNVPSLDNSGIISATVSSTDPTITSAAGNPTLSAWGIIDLSGTLTSITNETGGSISATAGTSVGGALNDNFQLARAIDVEYASSAVQINNMGSIVGDVFLGASNDTVTVSSASSTVASANLSGNIYFGGGSDSLVIGNATVGEYGYVQGALLETGSGKIAVTIYSGSTLFETNDGLVQSVIENQGGTGYLAIGSALPNYITYPNVQVSSLDDKGGTLGLTVAEPFNFASGHDNPIIASSSTIDLESGSKLAINFGGFVSAASASNATFVLLDAPTAGSVTIADTSNAITNDIASGIPFLFNYSICTYNTTGYQHSDSGCAGTDPAGSDRSDLVLNVSLKPATGMGGLGLTGYAAKMYDATNAALVNDSALGSAVIAAGAGITDATQGQAVYQKIYSQFAPDVTGATRALAISLTDSSSGPVGARQRALRMYANQDGEITLWSQEFTQSFSVSSNTQAAGYNDTGFGFVIGADGGSPANGRYGAAFTFYSGDTREKLPRTSRTNSEWYALSGYSDWRGRQMFFDSQISAGYANLDGKRTIKIYSDDTDPTLLVSRVATAQHSAEFLAGSISTGFILHTGGTSLTPQIDLDGLTMRQEAYTESNQKTTTMADDGFDLAVKQNYTSSLRAFAGLDLRQDLRFDGFYFQPEARAGYRYDFLDGADKITANFLSEPLSKFTIEGPDPSRGNLVLGGGFAVTTGAWSLGLNYDYKRGVGGTGGTDQTGTLTLLGRI